MFLKRKFCNNNRLKITLPSVVVAHNVEKDAELSDSDEPKLNLKKISKMKRESRLAEIAGDIATSQSCVSLLRDPTVFNFSRLRNRLKADNARLMTLFLKQRGLEMLFECLETFGQYSSNFSNLVQRLECVMCIKTVMNSHIGLESLISTGIYGEKFGAGKMVKFVLALRKMDFY